ncbi:MAG: hypothetical protein ACPGGE_06420, partial [Poseidonia sp.]
WRIVRSNQPRNVKATVLFNDLHRGNKATFDFKNTGTARVQKIQGQIEVHLQDYIVSRGDKTAPVTIQVTRSVGNSGDLISGFKLYGFLMLTVKYNEKTHNKWMTVLEEPNSQNLKFEPCGTVQGAILTEKTMQSPHVLTHIGPSNNWSEHALVPREEDLIKNLHPDPQGRMKSMKTVFTSHLETHGLRFSKFGDAGKGGSRSGEISLLFVPGFSVPVIDVQSLTAFRIEGDDNRVFNLERGRWKIDKLDPNVTIEIFSESSGSVHRAKVSIGSAEKVLTKTGKRHRNNTVFRRI